MQGVLVFSLEKHTAQHGRTLQRTLSTRVTELLTSTCQRWLLIVRLLITYIPAAVVAGESIYLSTTWREI